MNLKDILNEAAADQAHQRGLKSVGYGRWADKSGKIVARTVAGQLVAVAGPEQPKMKEKPAAKPTGTSAEKAGTKPSNKPTPKDVAKQNGTSKPAGEKGKSKGSGGEQAQPMAVHDDGMSHYRTLATFGKPVESDQIHKEMEHLHGHEAAKELIIGEEAFIVSDREWEDFFNATPHKNNLLNPEGVEIHAHVSAAKQDEQWRQKLDPAKYRELIACQAWWQEKPTWQRPVQQREKVSKFFDELAKTAPKCNVAQPIERGMRIDVDDIEDFLKNIRIGEEVKLPVCGFSAKAQEARDFATGGIGIVGIVWRLAPDKNGELHGIHFHGFNIPEDKTEEQTIYEAYSAEYESEQEIVRPSWAKTRCVGVKKLLSPQTNSLIPHVRCTYVIDVQEAQSDAKVHEGYAYDYDKTPDNPLFDLYMNTSFGSTKLMPIPKELTSIADTHPDNLHESEASDQAHALGLRYKGHGYWEDKEGVTRAQTVGNNLVKLEPNEVPAEHQGKAKTEPGEAPATPQPQVQHPVSQEKEPSGTIANYVMNKKAANIEIEQGMNEGGVYTGADGVNRYVKFYHNAVAAYDEKIANDFYMSVGIHTPYSFVFETEGKIGFASTLVANDGELVDFVDSKTNMIPKPICDEILNGFVADCFLANWDVIGVNEGYMRNIVLTGKGHSTAVCRIDNGGSLLTGGLGNLKPENALHGLAEWTFFPQQNPSYSAVFKGAGYTKAEQIPSIKQQIKAILDLRNDSGGWGKYMDKYSHDVPPAIRTKIAAMLDSRSMILMNKYKEMGGLHEDTTVPKKSKDSSCQDCTGTKRVHTCERCGAKRCPHYMKQSKTGYVCPTACGTKGWTN